MSLQHASKSFKELAAVFINLESLQAFLGWFLQHLPVPALRALTHAVPPLSAGISSGWPESPAPAKPFPHHVLSAVCYAPGHALQPGLAATEHPNASPRRGRVLREAQQQPAIGALWLPVPGEQRQPQESPAGVPDRAQPDRREQPAVPRQRQQPGGSGKNAQAPRMLWLGTARNMALEQQDASSRRALLPAGV